MTTILKFWMDIYVAAIKAGHGTQVAHMMANAAVDHYRAREI